MSVVLPPFVLFSTVFCIFCRQEDVDDLSFFRPNLPFFFPFLSTETDNETDSLCSCLVIQSCPAVTRLITISLSLFSCSDNYCLRSLSLDPPLKPSKEPTFTWVDFPKQWLNKSWKPCSLLLEESSPLESCVTPTKLRQSMETSRLMVINRRRQIHRFQKELDLFGLIKGLKQRERSSLSTIQSLQEQLNPLLWSLQTTLQTTQKHWLLWLPIYLTRDEDSLDQYIILPIGSGMFLFLLSLDMKEEQLLSCLRLEPLDILLWQETFLPTLCWQETQVALQSTELEVGVCSFTISLLILKRIFFGNSLVPLVLFSLSKSFATSRQTNAKALDSLRWPITMKPWLPFNPSMDILLGIEFFKSPSRQVNARRNPVSGLSTSLSISPDNSSLFLSWETRHKRAEKNYRERRWRSSLSWWWWWWWKTKWKKTNTEVTSTKSILQLLFFFFSRHPLLLSISSSRPYYRWMTCFFFFFFFSFFFFFYVSVSSQDTLNPLLLLLLLV